MKTLMSTLLLLLAALPSVALASNHVCEAVSFTVYLDLPEVTPGDPVMDPFMCMPAQSAQAGVAMDVAGELCSSSGGAARPLQVLVHGASYDHSYWGEHIPGNPAVTSYVRRAVADGYSVLSIDRLGAWGSQSTIPASSATLSLFAHQSSLIQIVGAIDAGGLATVAHGQVVPSSLSLVGHSLGGQIAGLTALAVPHLVDALIMQGVSHTLGPAALESFGANYSAVVDPSFAGESLDCGYLTTQSPDVYGAPTRTRLFLDPDFIVAGAVSQDERDKGIFTGAELGTIMPALDAIRFVTVPTLIVLGEGDGFTCALDEVTAPSCSDTTIVADEEAVYPAGNVEVELIEGAGHSINLHLGAWSGAANAHDVQLDWLNGQLTN